MSTKLITPAGVLKQHSVVLGKTGSGKSSALRHFVEHLLDLKKRVCIIDPKGDWWGLKSAADGKGPGYPVIMFGDFKEPKAQDVPINDHSGRHIAELVASGNRPCVIGMRGWTHGAMIRFWIDFAAMLFAKNAGELYLVGDEFHNFAPKQIIFKGKREDEESASPMMALHWSNRILSEGRGLGIVCLLASQRPQKVHNDTLTSCETLIAMRVIHKADRDAVKDWIDGAGDPKLGTEVLNALASMPRGEAYVWSPEIGYGPTRVTFPMFNTFDSFAPPQLQKKVSGAGWAEIDLGEVTAKLQTVVEEAKANDPKELKKTIAELQRQLRVRPTAAAPPPAAQVKTVEKFVLNDGQLQRAENLVVQFGDKSDRFLKAVQDAIKGVPESYIAAFSKPMQEIAAAIRLAKQPTSSSTAKPLAPRAHSPVVQTAPVRASANPAASTARNAEDVVVGELKLDKCHKAILTVLSQHPEGCKAGRICLLAGYTYGGNIRNHLADLRTAQLIAGANTDTMRITQAGMNCGPFEELPSGQGLIDFWLNYREFDKCHTSILRAMLDHTDGLDAQQVCELARYEYGGNVRNHLADLRTAGVIVGKNTEVMKPSEELIEAKAIAKAQR